MTKQQCKELLRISKEFIKLNYYLEKKGISKAAVYRFINSDDRDQFISEYKLNILCDEIYSCCSLYCDVYQEHKKIA